MSIKIEVNADSVEELADKLLAIGSRLSAGSNAMTSGSSPKDTGTIAAPVTSAKRTRRAEEPKAEEPEAEETKAEEPEAEETKAEETKAEETKAGAPRLDWDVDIAPVVTGYVRKHGREFVANVLDPFGVSKFSELPEDRWQEALDALSDAADAASVV